MENDNYNDIHIGETDRIFWIEFDTSDNDLFEVDYILAKYPDFWSYLEIFCVVGCCGINTFRFYPEDISKAASDLKRNDLKKDFLQLKQDIINSDKKVVHSSLLNNLVEKTVFIQLLDHIITHC